MKKVLLGTTALVAAGVLAGGVQAAEKVKLGVGGYFNSAFGYVDEDDGDGESGDGHYNHALNQDNEIHFKGETTLENGITVGARVELEGFTSGDQIDERWVYFRGGFGELRYGDEDDARKLKSYAAPTPTPNTFGVNSPYFTFNNLATGQVASSVSTFRNLDNDAAKIIYFTPSFGGFSLAGSYAPDGQQDRTGFGTGFTGSDGTGNCGNGSNLSVGADYSGDFGWFTLGAGGGYSMGDGKCETDDSSPWIGAGGVNVGLGNFVVGGSILMGEGIFGDDSESTEFDVGVTYTLDAITVGAGWSHADFENNDGVDDSLDHAQIGASYALGPGISVDAFVGAFDYDADDSDLDNTGWQTGIGTAISF